MRESFIFLRAMALESGGLKFLMGVTGADAVACWGLLRRRKDVAATCSAAVAVFLRI